MKEQQQTDYARVEKAIHYIFAHRFEQPSLTDIAAYMELSPHHFQKLFSQWAGISPKKFMQYLTLEHAKKLLKNDRASVLEAAYESGLSGPGRLHDLFANIEGMTPGEYKNGGEALTINYSFASTPFGKVIVAATPRGICHMFFVEDETQAINDLQARFPHATYQQTSDQLQQAALQIFSEDWQQPDNIKLHLAGTPFQLKVWESLLKIPLGQLTTYGDIAKQIGKPQASRAVGTAIGANPVAFLIPCHRVIQSTGHIGGYMWGAPRKSAIIAWESGRIEA